MTGLIGLASHPGQSGQSVLIGLRAYVVARAGPITSLPRARCSRPGGTRTEEFERIQRAIAERYRELTGGER